ncbi:MAG: glutathione synthase [Deltaproteobacteria bacterium]|nr:glutathione synthase [Deltaproteobacteria bacterium]
MKIAFLMDRLDSINPIDDTTAHLMYECNQRGHIVFFLEPHDIYVRENEVVARIYDLTVPPHLPIKKYWQMVRRCLKKDELVFDVVIDLDVIFLRKNPPLQYQTMEFLDPVSESVLEINSTKGQILGNSKLYVLNFPDIIPETHVSRDPRRLKRIIDDFGGDMVIKPLQRYGGEGVIKVSAADRENLNSLINYYSKSSRTYPEREPIMVQEYLDEVKREGDVRILLLNGQILGAMRRKPKPGDFRTNVLAGARAFRHEATAKERQLCRIINQKLVDDGLYFVGIDVIGDKLVGINCMSPGGIPQINRLDNVKLEAKVIDFIEQRVREKAGFAHLQALGP